MQDRLHDRVRLRTSPAALILTGGGARAAYQVGVLKAVAALLRDARRGLDPSIAQGHNPFPILVGTSAAPSMRPPWRVAPTTSRKPWPRWCTSGRISAPNRCTART